MTTPSLLHMQGICDKDCEVKKEVSWDPMYMVICNNCIHIKKQDHFIPTKTMEQLYDDAPVLTKISMKTMDKIFKFFMRNSG